MKQQIKKMIKPFAKPILNRFEQVNSHIDFIESTLEEKTKELEETYKSKIEMVQNQIEENRQNTINSVKNIFYYHGGSGNHGCEALLRTIIDINQFNPEEKALYSYRQEEDYQFKISTLIHHIYSSNLDAQEVHLHFNPGTIAFSVGGDNYCGYDWGTKRLARYNQKFNQNGAITALIGCSIEPDVLQHQEVLDDLEQFSLITARESITYDALVKHGITKNTHLIPDSAFTLEAIEKPLPLHFVEGKTVGINVSSLVQGYDPITYDNYCNLIQYMIDHTNYQIALIPHVVQSFNDDLKILSKLYRKFSHTNRLCFIQNCNCMELKGYIKRCTMFIGARTHSTIAAYSSCVPTLVLGYSVKSKGIAKDLFGTYDHYVLSVHDLKTPQDLVKHFKWLDQHQQEIRSHLHEIMPEYIKRCYELQKEVENTRKKYTSQPLLASRNSCTGCEACKSICPKHCIKMITNDKGFLEPQIDYKKCIHCNLCKQICPVLKEKISIRPDESYAVQAMDDHVRQDSSSGGVFTLLAEEIIQKGGTVFGAAMMEDCTVKHVMVNDSKNLSKLRGSKYVQSEIGTIYLEVKKKLKEGLVLFSGTPCQVAGLKAFLQEDNCNLYCVDVVCHGVPSPTIFKCYLQELEEKYHDKIIDVNFRYKDYSWVDFHIRIQFQNGKIINEPIRENSYMAAFLSNLILRPSCFECRFQNFCSSADITIGDYWGIENIHQDDEKLLDDKGTTFVMIQNSKGKQLFDRVKKRVYCVETDIDKAIPYNRCLTNSVVPHTKYEEFWSELELTKVNDILRKYLEERR